MQVTSQARAWTRVATAAAPGTCGELAQGVLPGGQRFHVTCPIDRWSEARVSITPARRTIVAGLARDMWKTDRALLRAAELLELPPSRIEITHASELERAKGLASSTADIVAAVRALAKASGQTLRADEIAALAAAVEPSDGVMYEGITAVDQHTGRRLRAWGWWPQFAIAMFRPNAVRETGVDGAAALPQHAASYLDLLDRLDAAAQRRDPAAFAEQATRSALLNDDAAPNPIVRTVLPHLDAVGAAGLCVGHSGTVCGLLFHGDDAVERAGAALATLVPRLPAGTHADMAQTPPSPAG